MTIARKLVWASLPAALWLGCRGDDDANGDAASDASQSDRSAQDAANAADVIDEPIEPYDCCPPPPPALTFEMNEATALCQRLAQCCGGDAGFDASACVTQWGLVGWESSNGDLLVPGVIDGGNLVLDQTAATSCLAGLATMSCPTLGSNEMKMLTANCFAAVSGVGVVGSPCRADSECQTTAYCTTSGKCAALLAQDASCARTGECAYKGGPSPALFCAPGDGSTCQPRLANDAGCASDDECASGICDAVVHACADELELGALCIGDAGAD